MKKIYYLIFMAIISCNTIIAKTTTNTTLEKVWGTYFGGTKYDEITDIKQTSEGNLILIGNTESADVPTSESAYQRNLKGKSNIILFSFDKDGKFLWGTYFGDSLTFYSKLLIDKEDNIYVIGITSDKALPTNNGYQSKYGGGVSDVIIIKFDKYVNFIKCTYFGGEGTDEITSANFDSEGNIIIGGNTTSTQNISTNGSFQTNKSGFKDVFITKINKELDKVIWSTYYGGEKDEYLFDFTIAENGDLVLTLSTSSAKIKVSDNAYQKIIDIDIYNKYSRIVVLARFSTDGNFVYSTYFGKTYMDFTSIASLGNDEFMCVGINDYYDFVTDDAYNKTKTGGDPYIIKFKLKDNFEPIYASYLNFPDLIYSSKVVLDKLGNYIILGHLNGSSDSTKYLNFTTSNAQQRIGFGGYTDCFIAKFDSNNKPQYITLVGGNDLDIPNRLLYDNTDSSFYLTGITTSDINIATPGSFKDKRYELDTNMDKGQDIFIIKFKESIITSVLDMKIQGINPYPNPARSTTRVNLQQEGQVAITAVDLLGRSFPLWSGYASTGDMELDVITLPTGSYTLLIDYGTKREA
ncbi:MAG: hypothetical protein ACPLX7_10015, partial [Candidatus Kapaibacteriota bacterium]